MTLMEGDIGVMSVIGDTSKLSDIIDFHNHCCVTGGVFLLMHNARDL